MLLKRVIVFTHDVERLAAFYRSTFGLTRLAQASPGWAELDAGGCNLAFHHITEDSEVRDGWVKLVFGTDDVAAEKARLEGLGVQMSDIVRFEGIDMCDGKDPDGNSFQISTRGM